MVNGIADGRIKSESYCLAKLVSLLQRSRPFVGKCLNVQTRTLGAEIAKLDKKAPGQLVLNRETPGLSVWRAVVAIDRIGIRHVPRDCRDKTGGECQDVL